MTADPKTDPMPAPAAEPPSAKASGVSSKPKAPAAVPANPGGPELGGPKGPEPTRYGDWERKGRCVDF